MSLSLALNSAYSGLKASQTQYGILSRNIENVQVSHYVRKNAVISSRIVAGHNLGLQVDVTRDVDEKLIRDVRISAGEHSALSMKAEYMKTWSLKIGQPQDESSVSSVLNSFKIALQTLEGSPGSQVDQLNVVRAAEKLATQINSLNNEAQRMVGDADGQIKARVDVINADLKRLEALNKTIAGSGNNVAAVGDLMDERDMIADRISSEIGITTYLRDNGEMVVLTRGGATLLDGSAVTLDFTSRGDLRTSDGTLLTPKDGNPSGIKSGALAGLFDVRDNVMPEFMKQLDDLASGIIRQFEAADGSLAPGQAGLFTDSGNPYNAANNAGLAGRIKVNSAVIPSQGGDVWRISAGIGATAPLPNADATQVSAFVSAFSTTMTFGSSEKLPNNSKLEDFAVSLVSAQQYERTSTDSSLRISKISLSTLQETRMNRDGVNVDDELMKVQTVQQSYQASAAVLKSVQDMLDQLLSIA
ncbi:flagellar hook-associated protein FlgK [Mesorhizobium sp. SP-1A]|uniref:flagellar hook-associated protein FlgK n=1 Tax=Mesorhizobium sp. SP-1A TaxID=3077840 RepID=UPI0028F71BED|nr:flagellar hook-associated protein FlgK [Mesorhizobium sp. SP-1A]